MLPATLALASFVLGLNLLADGLIDISRNTWIGVMESQGRDSLVSFGLDKECQQPKILHSAFDFVGYPVLSPDGNQMALAQ